MTAVTFIPEPPVTEDDGEDVIMETFEVTELDRRFFIHQKLARVGNDLVKHLKGGTMRGYDVFTRRRKLRQAVKRVLTDVTVREWLAEEIQDLGYDGMAAIAAAGGFNPEILSALYNGKDAKNSIVMALRRLASEFSILYSPMVDFTPSNMESWIHNKISPDKMAKILESDETAHDLWLLTKWAAMGRNWLWNEINGDRPAIVMVEIHAGAMAQVAEVHTHLRQAVAV